MISAQVKNDIERRIMKDGLPETLRWVRSVARLTEGKSGLFGVQFTELLPYLEEREKKPV